MFFKSNSDKNDCLCGYLNRSKKAWLSHFNGINTNTQGIQLFSNYLNSFSKAPLGSSRTLFVSNGIMGNLLVHEDYLAKTSKKSNTKSGRESVS